MKRTDSISIGDLMRSMIDDSQLAAKLDELQAAEKWPFVVGAEIARKSPKPTVRAGIMYVRIAEAPLRNELALNRSSLCRALNDIIGKPVIKEIRFVS